MKTIALSIILALALPAAGADRKVLAKNANQSVIYAVPVDYPIEARMARITGSGTYVVHVSPSGLVESVEVGQSTGAAILDRAAINAFKKWRFKPGTAPRIRIPQTWSLPGTTR